MSDLPVVSGYVFGAYLLTALVLGGYLGSLHVRRRAVEREHEALAGESQAAAAAGLARDPSGEPPEA